MKYPEYTMLVSIRGATKGEAANFVILTLVSKSSKCLIAVHLIVAIGSEPNTLTYCLRFQISVWGIGI